MAKAKIKKPAADTPHDDWHEKLIQWVNSSDDDCLASRELSEKSRMYYDSVQWSPQEVSKLEKQKQAATVRNRIKPKMDGLMGMERANRTTAKAFPRTPRHAKGATAATEAVRFVLDDNFYHQKRSAAWENALIEGTMGVEVIAEDNGDDVKITVNHLMWDRLIWDPHSRRKDFSDARFLGQVVWMDYDEAAAQYPEAKDVLETMISGSQTYDDKPRWVDGTRRRVKIVELYYYKPDGEVWYACFTRGGYVKAPKISPYKNEEGETEWPYEFGSLFVDREGGRYGACRQLLDIQDEINKRGSKALHLMSVRQVRGEKGAVEDVNKARAELAKPDGYVETTPGMEWEILKTGDMAAAQFNLLAEAKAEIDAVSYNAAAAGKENRNMSGVALRNREIAGQTEVAPMFDVLKHLDIRVYRKVWNRIKQYWKAEKWIRVTDDEHNLKWVGLNRKMTKGEAMLEDAKEQGAPPEVLQQMIQKIMMDPMMQQMADTQNDIANLDVDIVMADAPDTVTQQIEDFQTLGEMVKSGFPMPPIAVIEASPLSNKDRIIKMMKEGPQLSPEHQKQMDGMKEQMEKMQEEGQKLAQENQALKQDQTSEMEKIAAQRDAQNEKFRLEAEAQKEKQRLVREQFEFDKQLQIDKAALDLDLEERKAGAAHKQRQEELAFEQECRAKDEAAKNKEKSEQDNESEASAIAPKLIESMKDIVNQFAEIVAAQQEFQSKLLAEQAKPTKIVLQRDQSGRPVGATVN